MERAVHALEDREVIVMVRNEETFRCFVAVGLSDEARTFLGRFMKEAAPAFPSFRFGSTANLHITLQFLGDVNRAGIPALTEAISSAVENLLPFRMGLGEPIWFPRHGTPRGLHVSVGAGSKELSSLAATVSGALFALGRRPDRPFVAHITLGRARDRQGAPLADVTVRWKSAFSRFREAAGAPKPWLVDEVVLMESILGPGGSTYIPRGISPLKGKPDH